jgi:hypothetical protein
MSPRETPTYADRVAPALAAEADADPSEGRSFGRTAGTIALFAVIALPLGILISSIKTREQIRTEQAAFRRLGLDWEKRFPK